MKDQKNGLTSLGSIGSLGTPNKTAPVMQSKKSTKNARGNPKDLVLMTGTTGGTMTINQPDTAKHTARDGAMPHSSQLQKAQANLWKAPKSARGAAPPKPKTISGMKNFHQQSTHRNLSKGSHGELSLENKKNS